MSDAKRHTKLANTPRKRKIWAIIANSSLKAHGDEGRAIRLANHFMHRLVKK
jgi:hypothetical protein